MRLEKYYENLNNEVTIGDVIRVRGSTDKDGIYIMLCNEQKPCISQTAQKINIRSNGQYEFCDFGGLSCQIGDEDAEVIILYNILKTNHKLNNNCMNLQNKIKKITRKEPEKSFVKCGFLDECENITEDGKDALLYILWNEKKEELKKLAYEILEEETNR